MLLVELVFYEIESGADDDDHDAWPKFPLNLCRLAMGAGQSSQKAVKRNVRSRSQTFSWSGRSSRRQRAKDLCGCPEAESSTSYISPFVPPSRNGKATRRRWLFGSVMDPQSRSIKDINRLFLLACTLGMFIDPLFLDTLTIDDKLSCLYVDKRYLLAVSVLRAMIDVIYLWHIWLQLKLAYVSKKSLVPGRGELVWDARDVALHYLCALRGFVFDAFVILPIPQVRAVLPNPIQSPNSTFIFELQCLNRTLLESQNSFSNSNFNRR